MLTFSDEEVKQQIHDDVGIKPHFSLESFSDLDVNVRQSIARIKTSPFIPNKESVRGFVYEVESARFGLRPPLVSTAPDGASSARVGPAALACQQRFALRARFQLLGSGLALRRAAKRCL